jgi:hypothetical protein
MTLVEWISPLPALVYDHNKCNAPNWHQPACHILGTHPVVSFPFRLSGKIGYLWDVLDCNEDSASVVTFLHT